MKNDDTPKRASAPTGKQAYHKLALKYGRAFETMAFACGEISTAQQRVDFFV
ncbi:MAG: hypothetical protein ABSC23_05635 [Bryobacteraceae bacterium]